MVDADCNCPSHSNRGNYLNKDENELVSDHHLAVIVPFRNRFDELIEFLPHMHQFLKNQSVSHEIFVVNQVDDYRFNRASLINVGFLHIVQNTKKFDYIVMHDVDLLPVNHQLKYDYPGDGNALHIASPELHPKYHYEKFVGGILILTVNDYQNLNGLSNKYWGWGLEDDEFYLRMKQGGVTVLRPVNITTGTENTFRHVHDHVKRVRDKERCFDQKAASRKRDRVTGLHDVSFTLQSITSMTINSAPGTLLNIALTCNKTKTPWCRKEPPNESSNPNVGQSIKSE
nr:EOG090X0AZ6 [Eurycercus lamellatus]